MSKLELNYPHELPVCEHREEILSALRSNDVIIVCGDTGSGKTTQLPKMALELQSEPDDIGNASRHTRIACTQPRRLAAVTMAERVAAELKTEIGGLVGYRHRFGRKVSSETRIEFMTDGVLLAETRFDPLLRAYDTIIVDEAHERSLNIDFLLGILKRILRRRSDLKVIISSATLDARKFSEFFDSAPTVIVPGRLFPIEIGYRPPSDGEERDLPHAVATAVAELPPEGDILVFLPGERDIRETADYLGDVRRHDDIIPLLASLPSGEQRRAFLPSDRRRIILATNVAETSVTIPGIRAVVDSGLARISRYVHRTQVQRLQVETISKASAKQRTGRCGRLGPGICLRLYSEEDFTARDDYTPPEVLRSSLAGVILTMLDLKLGDIEQFPFIDPPRPTMIHEGLRELLELGAIRHDQARNVVLTGIGRKLAKIPVEPRLARMLLAASENGVLPSILPLVAALSCDDPRRRPIDEREKADQAHAKFRVQGSDFLGTLKLWRWWMEETKSLSQSKARKLCKETFLSYPKMREWRDLEHQLGTLSQRLGLDVSTDNGEADNIHRSLLAGLLGRIGRYDEEERDYRGAHGVRFAIHPGSVLAKALKRGKTGAPPWVVAGELVDTARLFARDAAIIDVRWLEAIAGPICRHSYHSPEWDPQSGFVRATEQVTLYGLVIVPARRCDFSRIDPQFAREIFIRRGLVDCEFPKPPPSVRANQHLICDLRERSERSRHPEIFDADKLFAHFDKVIPSDICSAPALRKWLSRGVHDDFVLKKKDWWPRDTGADRDFPSSIRIAGVTIALSYDNCPDDPDHDGITCSVRKSDASVLKLWRADWLVPGLLPGKIIWMLGMLPSALRRVLSPFNETVSILLSMLKPGSESLEAAVTRAVNDRWGFRIPDGSWNWGKLPPHLKMRFRLRDDNNGRTLLVTNDISEALAFAGISATGCMMAADKRAMPSTEWTFGTIPQSVTDRNSGWETTAYPALHDEGSGVMVRLYSDAVQAEAAHAAGVARLYLIKLKKAMTVPFKRNRAGFEAALYLKDISYDDNAIAVDILHGAIRETLVRGKPEVRTKEEFEARLSSGKTEIARVQAEMTSILVESAAMATRLYALAEDDRINPKTADSIATQISWLIYPGFPKSVPLATLRHYRRYLKGANIRLERAKLNPNADLVKEEKFAPYWERYRAGVKNAAKLDSAALDEFRWMLEEYRVSIFAQELRTPGPVSPKRLDSKWADCECIS